MGYPLGKGFEGGALSPVCGVNAVLHGDCGVSVFWMRVTVVGRNVCRRVRCARLVADGLLFDYGSGVSRRIALPNFGTS